MSLISPTAHLQYTAQILAERGWFASGLDPPRLIFSPTGAAVMIQAPQASRRPGPLVIAVLAVLLLILHQDYWFWTDRKLVMGSLPIGLFWHICISIAATLTWYLATRIAWPQETPNDSHSGESSGGAPLSTGPKEGR